jgi:hypothetical protein
MAFWNCPEWGLRECGLLCYGSTVGPGVGCLGLICTPTVAAVQQVWEKCAPKKPFCEEAQLCFDVPRENIKSPTKEMYWRACGFSACSLIPICGGILGANKFFEDSDPWPDNWCCPRGCFTAVPITPAPTAAPPSQTMPR